MLNVLLHVLKKHLFYRSEKEIAVVYFRTGYSPEQYPSDKVNYIVYVKLGASLCEYHVCTYSVCACTI